ncbi:hypothetical protein AC1031_009941 [Aphanomyces cochlioides]|nr:hypothetical protein AC1031_009941 [Aphanomyces cochlioides]
MDDAWDIATDLPFLIAKDDELSDELAQVSAILTSIDEEVNESSKTVSSHPKSVKRTSNSLSASITAPAWVSNKYEFRQRQELRLLQKQVTELKEQLELARIFSAKKLELPKWERAARLELQAKLRAIAENEQLKADIQGSTSFIATMQKYFRKKPRLSMDIDIHSEEWMEYKLAAQASLRIAAIHAIADRQYRRMETAFINANLIGVGGNVFCMKPIRLANSKVIVQLINHVTLAAPCHAVGMAIWQTFHIQQHKSTSQTVTEVIDANTVYEQYTEMKNGTPCHSNTISKLYIESNRDVIVWRTVHEDEMTPDMIKGAVEDQWGWIELTPLENPKHCRLTLLMQVMADTNESALPQLKIDTTVDSIVTTVEKFSCSSIPQLALPTSEPLEEIDRLEMKEGLPASLLAWIERGRRKEILIRRAVNRAILDFNDTSPQREISNA